MGKIKKIKGENADKKEEKTRKTSGKVERVPTFIKDFDSLVQGGFEKNSANLLVGSSGSGKTIFAAQYLLGGIVNGEKCLYVTFEEKKSEFFRNMKEFGWDFEEYEKNGILTFLEYTPSKVKTMLDEGGGEIENIILSKKITRMVIDSVTSFALLFDDELSKREASLSLFNLINSWNCTSLLTYEEETLESGLAPASKALQFESDSIINIYFLRNKEVRERYLEVLKMRGTDHSRGIHELKVTNKGIYVNKA